MTIQDLGSLGELIAALATIATLAYLAIQIRQNTRTVRAASTTAHIDSVVGFTNLLGQNPELNDLYFAGLSGDGELSESQIRQFHMLMSSFLMGIQQAYLLNEEGIVHSDINAWHKETLDWLASQPGFGPYWDVWGNTFPPGFRDYVGAMLR
jgi:hypothetical protein